MASTYADFAAGKEIKLERGYRHHAAGWGYEGVLRHIGEGALPSGRLIATEEVVMGCGGLHATAESAKACEDLPANLG
jgi:hypothetical protein